MRALMSVGAAAVVAATLVAGCSPRYIRSEAVDPLPPLPSLSLTRNVVLVSIDGLRPDAIGRFAAPTLQRLIREGSYSLSARTIMPSKTLPSHTSMLSGEPPDEHGVFWNNVVSAKVDVVKFPTVFSVARARGYQTAAFFSKAKFGALQRPGTLDYSQAPGGWFGRWPAERTIADVRTYLATSRPNLLFVHLSDPDRAGHSSGWMSPAYGRAVEAADTALARLLSVADATYGQGNYSLLVTADHGGHAHNHGSSDPQDVTIPWIAWGRGVHPGALADTSIHTFDTAATVLWLLGVDEPAAWDGAPIVGAFQPRPMATD